MATLRKQFIAPTSMKPYSIHARAADVPLTQDEISRATVILDSGPVCVANLQRRLAIGWNRAADLIAHIKGVDSLPLVARRIMT